MAEERMKVTSPVVELVLPAYNEAHVLADSIDRLRSGLGSVDLPPWRIVIVDNGSTDDSPAVGAALAARFRDVDYQRLERKGRGFALRTAWSTTSARYSIYMDVDLSTDLAAVPEAVTRLGAGADVVSGSRLSPRAQTRRGLKREVLSRGYNALVALLFRRRGFDDAQCGFKGVRVDSVRELLPLVRNDHWFFDTELLVLARSVGLEVQSFPVRWREDEDSRVHIASTVWEDLWGLTRLRTTLTGSVREWDRSRDRGRRAVTRRTSPRRWCRRTRTRR